MSEDGRCRTCGTITNLPPRLTHAERAKVSITVRNINTALVSLDKSAEIERVAREVCAEAGKHYIPSQLGLGPDCTDGLGNPFPAQPAACPTHAERAKGAIPYDLYEAHLDVAAKIERVAKEVVTEWDNINNPDELELGRAMDRLRALVQP